MTPKEAFKERYKIASAPDGSWHISDTAERKIEAGPWRNRRTAEEVLLFMSQYVHP